MLGKIPVFSKMYPQYFMKCHCVFVLRSFRLVTYVCNRRQRFSSENLANCPSREQNFAVEDAQPDFPCEVQYVPRTYEEYKEQKGMRPVQPENPRFLRVAVIGDPNAGKSTLTNQLTGWRVCSVSSKVHTTRRASSTILNINDTQLEFTDTPGTVSFEQSMKHSIESKLVYEPERVAKQADVLLALIDVSNIYTRHQLSPELKGILEKHKNKRSMLVLNKIDSVRHRSALMKVARGLCNGVVKGKPYGTEVQEELILPNDKALKKSLFKRMDKCLNDNTETQPKVLKGWSNFSEVFMVSAVHGEGVSSLLDYLLRIAPHHPWKYHSTVVTKDDPQVLTKRVLREKLLNKMNEEIGYKLKLQINSWEINEADVLRIGMTVKCPKKNLVSMVIGPSGKYISELSKNVQQELSNVFHCDVQLHIAVRYEQPLEAKKK